MCQRALPRGQRLGRSALLEQHLGEVVVAQPHPRTLTHHHSTQLRRLEHRRQEIDTPALDALRRDSVLFDRAYSHTPLTLPSHVSILAGLLPPEHGVRDNIGYPFAADGKPYLPAVLGERGYATGAAVSAFVLRGNTGLARSFDFYEDEIGFVTDRDLGSLQRPGGETLKAMLPWLESVADRPFFLFFHIYEPHSPYEPAEPWASRYPSAYDGEVAAASAAIGRLIAELERLGIYDRCLPILLSDHGEGLMDHGEQEHQVLLYRELLQVPLLLKLPGGKRGGTRVEHPVQLVDVVPTILGMLRLEIPARLRGSSLLADDTNGEARSIYGENVHPRLHFGWSDLGSLIRGRYQLIDGPAPELYDLVADPAERHNLAREERRILVELRRALEGFDRSLARPQEVDSETRGKLAALGYLGGTSLPESEGPLPDPKSHLASLELLQNALALAGAGEDHDAASLLLDMGQLDEARAHAELALASHEAAYGILAEVALEQEDLEAADRWSREAMARRGTRVQPLVVRARVLVERQRYREALALTKEAESELAERPDRDALGGLYLARGKALASLGDDVGAITAFRREIELDPKEIAPYTHLALVYALTGRASEVGATLRRLVETNRTARAHAEAVRTLRALGDERSADAVLAQARRRWPNDPELQKLGG